MRFSIFFLVFISACSNHKPVDSGDGFYTWVDERGMIHTQKKPKSSSSDRPKVSDDNPLKVEGEPLSSKFNPPVDPAANKNTIVNSDYVSSDDIDKKLAGDRLFSWTQDGRQVVAELSSDELKDQKSSAEPRKQMFRQSLIEFREAKEILLSALFSRQINLEDFYQNNKTNKQDYILIEIDVPNIGMLMINSFVSDNKIALPQINILNHAYESTPTISDVFDSYAAESWSSYGRFSGSFHLPVQARYLLIRPNPTLGVIETVDGDITLVDLGAIQITN